jgi:hypothetical protein
MTMGKSSNTSYRLCLKQQSEKHGGKKVAEVSPNRIALMGISLGGYTAARAAAFEPDQHHEP